VPKTIAAGLGLAAALLATGCAVARLPDALATGEQTPTQRRLDIADCKAEVGYRTNYNGDHSPLVNGLRNAFTLGVSGAALGGLVTGFPGVIASGTDPSWGLIAGAGAGGLAGGGISWSASSRFEREWIACMESRGYHVVATPEPIH
jgi:hypothetical protein